MASKRIFFQDESIQLLETASSQENLSQADSSSPSILKIKRKNKIHSPPPLSPSSSVASSNDISDLFKAKKKLPPVSRLRTGKILLGNKSENPKNTETTFIESHTLPSPKSDTISYKEQLRNRFLTVKKQAGSSISHTPVSKTSRKSRNSVDHIFFGEENEAIELELKKRELNSSRNDDDGFDFFCKINNKNEDNEITKADNEEKDRQEDEIDEPEDNEKDSIIEFLGLDLPDSELTEMFPTEKINIADYEQDLFWNPYSVVGRYEEREEMRVLEEDGIYKADEPTISSNQLNKLKEKLFSDDARNWFEDGNRLKILLDPRIDMSFKPFKSTDLRNELIQGLKTEYTTASVYEPIFKQNFNKNMLLELQLYNIKFMHHPLFSPEHVLSQKLNELYEKFLEKKTSNKLITLEKTLHALITAKIRFKNTLSTSGDNVDFQIVKYQAEINETRNKMYEEGKSYRELIKSILYTWRMIKIVRDNQKYINTPFKLLIRKEYDNYEDEKNKWDKNIEDEVGDMMEEYEKEFRYEIDNYKSMLKEWKTQKRNITEEDEDELPEKPKKPQRNLDIEKITSEVVQKCKESLKHPGEPILDFELLSETEILTKDVVNPKELLRRSEINKTQIYIKITCDKQVICKSKTLKLNNNFICEYNEPFSIHIASEPKYLNMEIYEEYGQLNKRMLYLIDLLDKKCNNEDDITKEIFIKNEKIHHNHTGVGSAISTKDIFKSLDIDITEDIKLYTSGLVNWNINTNTNQNEQNKMTIDNTKPINLLSTSFMDAKYICDLSKTYIDPQDPQNSIIYEYIKSIENIEEIQNFFRLEPNIKFFEFFDAIEIENNLRFKMLSLRDKNEPEFQGIIVPNRIKEITKYAFLAYEKRCAENESPMVSPEDFQKDDFDGQRKWALKYLQIAENQVIQLSKIAENKICLLDVLTEDNIPTLGSLGLSFMNWLQPNRPLRPTRRTAKPSQTTISIRDAKIIINIIGAIQVPIRKDMDPISPKDPMPLVPVRPFVIVSFKDKQARTTVAEGANPIWNQELTIPLENVNETIIHNIHGTLHLNLYDETISNLTEDDRLRHTNIHQQLGYNWLGGINFPISTLLYNKRIDGSFKINSPAILLGYENNCTQFYSDTVSHRQDTYLTVFVTMQPTMEKIRKIQPTLYCTEMQYMEEHIKNWEEEYKLLFSHRPFSSLVTNINGEMTCVTRYFKAMNPPKQDTDIVITKEFCARYVSMIPFRESTLFHKIPSIWLAAEQLLTLSVGTVTDHSILLTCFLMALDVPCWLIIGYGIPHGITSYVLIKEKSSFGKDAYFIYDVETAFKYSIQDNFCPLQKVFCVINNENLWGNIQIEERAHMTKYDLTKKSDWLPLFAKNISAPTLNLQKIPINHIVTPSVVMLQERIEKKLKQKIMKWRKHNVTIWNHYCSSVLRQLLPYLEENSFLGNNVKEFEELQGLFNSYKMRGFAINFPYTSFKQISSYVRGTKIFFNENPNTEFALGVYIHSYPNYTIVVWLFLASVIRRR